jgi:hypothetical protein
MYSSVTNEERKKKKFTVKDESESLPVLDGSGDDALSRIKARQALDI